jgi:glycosyltransferase involved in cell wall biosynthesis
MNNESKNSIDVIIPVYNGKKFILQALDSVVHQTLSPSKIIVVDDGSTDKTHELITEFAKTSGVEIQIIKKENGGLSSARNAGIKASTADFIAFLDADDVWVNNKLEKQLEVFKSTEFGNLGLVYCKYDLINEGGEKTTGYVLPLDKKFRGYVFSKMLAANKILSSGSGVLIKKEVLENAGFFDEELKFGEDWDMWIRIAEKFEVDYVDETLVHIRRHANNMSASLLSVFEGEIEFYNKWIPKLKNKHPIPLAWSDRIIFRMIKISPKGGLVSMLKKKMRPDVYKELFTKKFASIYLYMAIFPVRMIIKTILSPRNLLKLIK